MKLIGGRQVVVLSCMALGFLSACDSLDLSFLFVTPASAESTKTKTVSLSDGAKVVVNNNNGGTCIKVDADATKATIKITRIAFAQDEATADALLDKIVVTVTEPTLLDNTLTIDAPLPSGATDDTSSFNIDIASDDMDVTDILMGQQVAVVNLTITLPPDFYTKVTHKNGIIVAAGLDDDSDLTVENGTVKVEDATGAVAVKVTDGQVKVTNHEGSLDASVENGAVTIGVISLGSSEKIVATATNGQITLTLPEGIDADLAAAAQDGTISFSKSDFDTVPDVTQTLKSVTATLNNGGPTIDLQAQNGAITISGS